MIINVQTKREAKIRFRFAATLLFRGTLIPINFFINTRFAFLFWTLVTIYFPYYPLFVLRSVLRSVLVQFSFSSRSVLDRSSIDSRSSFVHPPFILRSGIEDRSKIDRRTNGESSEARRRCIETLMGNQGKGDPNKNFIFNHLNSIYYGKTYWNYFQTQSYVGGFTFKQNGDQTVASEKFTKSTNSKIESEQSSAWSGRTSSGCINCWLST